MNKNTDTTYPNLWNAAKAVLGGKVQLETSTFKREKDINQ